MLAQRFPDDEERGRAVSIALTGLACGVLGKLLDFCYDNHDVKDS